MKVLLYINNERCNTFEMLENHFLSVKTFDDVFYDLVDLGRYKDLANFLREVGELEKADKIDAIDTNLNDSCFFSEMYSIIIGDTLNISLKPEFQDCFSIEDPIANLYDDKLDVDIKLKVKLSIDESYQVKVETNWGTRAICVNPSDTKEGEYVSQKITIRKKPGKEIGDVVCCYEDQRIKCTNIQSISSSRNDEDDEIKEIIDELSEMEAPNSVKELIQFLYNNQKQNGNNGKEADPENVNGLKAPVSHRDTSVQDKPISGEPKRYRWQTDSFLRQIEKDKKEREQRLEHQKNVREELEMKYKFEQEERERKEMEEKYRRKSCEQETKGFKCPKCGYCTQIPYKKVKYRCHMCGRVWSV